MLYGDFSVGSEKDVSIGWWRRQRDNDLRDYI